MNKLLIAGGGAENFSRNKAFQSVIAQTGHAALRRCRSAPLVIAPRLYQPCAPPVGRQTSPSASAACLTSQRCRSFRHATTPIPGIVAESGYHDTGGDAPGSAQAGQ